MQLQQGISREADRHRGDMEIRFLNGLPNNALLRATPRNAVEEITDLGLFIDEKWSVGHVTLSGGLRYDYFNGTAPDQWSPAGTWVPARLTTRVENIPNWRDINPRLGVAWDMFGNARTALKFTTGRFVDQAVAAPTRALNPMRQISETDTAELGERHQRQPRSGSQRARADQQQPLRDGRPERAVRPGLRRRLRGAAGTLELSRVAAARAAAGSRHLRDLQLRQAVQHAAARRPRRRAVRARAGQPALGARRLRRIHDRGARTIRGCRQRSAIRRSAACT